MIRRLSLACALALLAASAASAQGMRANPDTNKDGYISKAEHMAVGAQRFKRMDANSDGVIDGAEQARVAQFMGGTNPLKPADLNKDGKVTRAEFDTAMNLQFVRADTDKDNRLSKAELDAMRPKRGK